MDPLGEAFRELRREYLSEAPARLAELWKDANALAAGEPGAAGSLRTRFHRLAGSGGSYGFPDISRIAREAEGLLAAKPTPDIAADLRRAVERIAEAFDRAGAELGASESAHRDDLTGLLDDATLMAELESAVTYSRRHGAPVSFAVFELDHSRLVNDQHGHQTGDRLLVHVAELMRNGVRASDLLGRYGGEAIGLVLRGSDFQGAVMLAAKLRRLVAEHPATTRDGAPIALSMSAGCASFPGDGETAADLARAADRALAKAKAGGRDRVEPSET